MSQIRKVARINIEGYIDHRLYIQTNQDKHRFLDYSKKLIGLDLFSMTAYLSSSILMGVR